MREYRVDPDTRKQNAIKRIVQVLTAGFGVAIAIKLARGLPLLDLAYSDLFAVILLPILFFFRGRWGDRLVFDEGAVLVYRDDVLRQTIPLAAIEKVSRGEDSLSLKWKSKGRTEHQLIAKEGFTDGDWQEIKSLLESGRDV